MAKEKSFEKLVEFSIQVLNDWISAGYEFVRYEGKGDHGILTPIKYNDLGEDGYSNDYYNLTITDIQCFEMASGIPEFNFLTKEYPNLPIE